MIDWRTLVLVSAFSACVESPPGRPDDAGTRPDGANADAPLAADGTADAWPVDVGPEFPNDTDRPDGSDSGVDFFSTPGCYLSQGDCAARREGVRCQALFGGIPRAAEQCRERVFLGCMEHVRSTSPAAVCLRRQEANGVSATYVVANAYDYEFLAEHERYAWGVGQCEAAFGWPYCAAP
jgi:hypothetical protein